MAETCEIQSNYLFEGRKKTVLCRYLNQVRRFIYYFRWILIELCLIL